MLDAIIDSIGLFFTNPILLGQLVVNGISLSAIHVLVALGFMLLFGIMRVVNFAHGEFAMLSGLSLYYRYGGFTIPRLGLSIKLPWLIAVPLSALAVAVPALILERLVFRWFHQRMFQSMIGLMGLSMIMVFGSLLIWDAHERQVPAAFTRMIEWGEVLPPLDRLVVIGVAMVTLAGFYMFITYTRAGLAMRAAAQDLELAETQGIDTRNIYRIAFFVAVLLAALAGALFAQTYRVSPFMGERPLMVAFIVVILGGMGSIPGAALGGIILGFTESFLGTMYRAAASAFASFGVVILLLIFRPWGLLGTPE